MAEAWVSTPVDDVRAGDRVRHGSGQEFEVARIDAPFLGRDDMVCLIEDTPTRWHAYPARRSDFLEVWKPV